VTQLPNHLYTERISAECPLPWKIPQKVGCNAGRYNNSPVFEAGAPNLLLDPILAGIWMAEIGRSDPETAEMLHIADMLALRWTGANRVILFEGGIRR